MGFIEHHKIIAVEEARLLGCKVHVREQSEKERVVEHDHGGFLSGEPGAGMKTVGWGAAVGGAEVAFAGDFFHPLFIHRPGEFREEAVARGVGPIVDVLDLAGFWVVEEPGAGGEFHSEAVIAEIILATHELGKRPFAPQDFFSKREIFVNELGLEIDSVCGHNELLASIECVEDGGDQVAETFAHACACFDEELIASFEGSSHGASHAFLLGAVLVVGCAGEFAARRKVSPRTVGGSRLIQVRMHQGAGADSGVVSAAGSGMVIMSGMSGLGSDSFGGASVTTQN